MSHVTRTPLSRSKGQRSTCRGGGILWRLPAQLVIDIGYAALMISEAKARGTGRAENICYAAYANCSLGCSDKNSGRRSWKVGGADLLKICSRGRSML